MLAASLAAGNARHEVTQVFRVMTDTVLESVDGAGVKQCQKIIRAERRMHGVGGQPDVPPWSCKMVRRDS